MLIVFFNLCFHKYSNGNNTVLNMTFGDTFGHNYEEHVQFDGLDYTFLRFFFSIDSILLSLLSYAPGARNVIILHYWAGYPRKKFKENRKIDDTHMIIMVLHGTTFTETFNSI
jgi:hypothetical protein